MRRFAPHVPCRTTFVRLVLGTAVAVALAMSTIQAQIPSRNVNMVSGDTWPEGDPLLQRQNEPSIAASTRNPLHLLAGSNDYRTVDLPGLGIDEIGDAWLGLYKSFDGGQRWTSSLLPGYPQDELCDPLKTLNPDPARCAIHGYGAGADPVVRAGTNGLIYYAGLAFDRSLPATPDVPGKSAIFVARFIDNNNKENGDTFQFLGTRKLQTDPGGVGGNFLDKPWMVVDIPRNNARCSIVTPTDAGPINQSVPAGPLYVAYTLKSTDNQGERYDVFFTMSTNCGDSWTPPVRLNDKKDRANQGATMTIDPRNGNVHTAWRSFDLEGDDDALMTVKFDIKTKKFDALKIARKYLKHKKKKKIDIKKFFKKGGIGKAIEAAVLSPLDQGTSDINGLLAFRTNAYPSITADQNGRLYLVWAERGYAAGSPDPVTGDARVVISTSNNGNNWSDPVPIADETVSTPGGDVSARGHQLMPSIAFAGGKLMVVYYDLRETRSKSFNKFIDDKTAFNDLQGTGLRHTLDIRASMATPGAPPVFSPSVRVSDYLEGPMTAGGPNVPLQVNPPNLPMFMKGTAPFIGDYVDVTAAPSMIQDATGKWTFNTAAGPTAPIFHATWTDNRDVRAPLEDRNADGNPWNDYTPPNYLGGFSPLDPTRLVPVCIPGNAGSRNQNVYSARITGGILVGSPGNTKRLGFKVDDNGQPTSELMQRSFVVFAQNTSDVEHIFRLAITSQPPGGRASFTQFDPLVTVIEAIVPRRSTASRTVYVTSTDPHARVDVSVTEIAALNGAVVPNGLGGVIVLNPDIDNPDIDNPDIDNPDIDNPDIDNLEVYNPDIDNPDIDNPDIDNPDIDNPDIDNPDIDNIRVANPDIDNPDIDNPDIDNPDIDNPDIDNPDIDNPDIDNASLMTDVSWSITNNGNTTAAYNVNLFFAQTTFRPQIKTQLILYRTYRTPVVQNCALKFETHNVIVANVPNPQLVKSSTGEVSDPNDPEPTNATIYLAPGESAKITLRVFDPNPPPGTTVVVTNQDGSTAIVPRAFVPNEDVTPVVQQQSVNTEDVEAGVVEPPIVVQIPAPQAEPDFASTAPQTPVTINVLANDSTAFGSTKVLSLHPAGMATHSGGGPGDITYQPSSGFLYTGRGAIDPNSDSLVGRFGLSGSGFFGQQANPRTGVIYGRTFSATSTVLTALDARPGSPTFHQYLSMPAVTNTVLNTALDTAHHRLYVMHGTTPAGAAVATAALSAIDIDPASATFHNVLFTTVLPGDVRGQAVAVNSRTQKVYVTSSQADGGVYVLDVTVPNPPAVKIANTSGSWGIVVNEAANLVFAATAGPSSTFALYAIDGASLATTMINTTVPMRFSMVEERLALHEATGKLFMRLETTVVIIDGQRGSPTRNTVVGVVSGLGPDPAADIAIDQELGLVITIGGFDFRADIIDVASHGLVATIPLLAAPSDVAIDAVHHRAFVSVPVTYVQEISLNPIAPTAQVAVFIESSIAVVNPVTNRAYSPFQAITGGIAKVSGAGFDGVIPGVRQEGRYVDSARYNPTNRYFILNQGNQAGMSPAPGSMVVIDGATDAVLAVIDTLPQPFGIGINQATGKVYVATLQSPLGAGGIQVFDANDLTAPPVLVGGAGTLAPPPINPFALQTFGRYVVPNPATGTTYALQLNANASATSIVAIDPATGQMTALDGSATAPLGDAWGRVDVIRVSATNRVYLGMLNTATNTVRIVALDGATHAVLGTWVGGRHSGRHTASYLIENNDRLYVVDYNNDIVTMLDGLTMLPLATTALPDGPSATAFNVAANRLYVSSVNSKTLTAVDGTTLAVRSSVRLPLVAHFLFVDEVESRLYTSGGAAADESGIMVVTDVLGQLGTSASVSAVGTSSGGAVHLNPDYSVTYTPEPGFTGPDQFTYTITAPTGTATGTVTVNVVPSIPSSAAFADSYTTPVNQILTVATPGPMGNDATGGPTTMVVTQPTTNGVLTEHPDGSFTYQPNPGFTGTDTFLYHTVGALGASNTTTVTIAVTSGLDLLVGNTNDSGAGSLRQAMLTANIEPGSMIRFNISGSGPFTIQPATALPTMNVPVTIDGFTQPGSSPNTAVIGTNAVMQIVVRGPASSGGGLNLRGGHSTIRGLVINGFSSGNGILLDGASGSNTIEGNFIGTDATGTAAVANQTGVSSQSPDNLIGGIALASRNLISGNSNQGARALASSSNGVIASIGSGTMFKNNLIGTTASGMSALANGGGGLTMSAPNVVIGGTTAAERNVISGNGNTGVSAFANAVVSAASGLVVQGNFIGTTADGLAPLGNNNGGVSANGPNTTIGGTAGTTPGGACTGACNVISGNSGNGVSLGNSYDNNSMSPFRGTLFSSATNSAIEGNYIGVDVNGNAPAAGSMGNTNQGVFVGAPGARIGGGSPASRNVISGNGSATSGSGINIGSNTVSGTSNVVGTGAGAVIRGNYIGLNAAGTAAVANNSGVNLSVPNVRIGGTNASDRNIISGNQQWGINSFASTFNPGDDKPLVVLSVPSGLVVQGNYIGTSVNGLAAIGNGTNGINVNGPATIGGGTGTTPGGACTGACNLVSGNGGTGVSLNHHVDNTAGASLTSAAGSVVEGNYVGVNVNGTTALGNLGQGIYLGASGILVGGGSPATRNVIGGNTSNNAQGISAGFSTAGATFVGSAEGSIIRGNYIGLRADGSGVIPNGNGIHVSAPNVRIGGTTAADRNVISGNLQQGISTFSGVPFGSSTAVSHPSGLIVQGNYVGTSPDGLSAMGNGSGGINVSGANSIIGGTTGVTTGGACTGACNLVSGNGQQGISADHSFNFTNGTVYGSATGTTIAGNYVGLDVLGFVAIPNNGNGINVNAPNVLVGGSTPADRNLVAGNTNQGISVGANFTQSTGVVGGGDGSIIRGNWVGFNAAGTVAFPNGQNGIGSGVPNVTIGGPSASDGNVVVPGSFSSGINLYRSMHNEVLVSTGGNSTVQHNLVGTNPAGTARMNTAGSGLNVQSDHNQILNNVIAGNGTTAPAVFATGISLFGSFATDNIVRGNFIGTNVNGDPGLGNTGSGIYVDGSNNTIGGVTAADRNVIAGNLSSGISIGTSPFSAGTASGNAVLGNYIGVVSDGVTPLPNDTGVSFFTNTGGTVSGNTIGGTTAGHRNIISGNLGSGVSLGGSTTTGNFVTGNYIGVAFDGVTPAGNASAGIFVNDAQGNTFGANLISFNQVGIALQHPGVRNQILGNAIRSNTGLGIDLGWDGVTPNDNGDTDTGANNRQNFPVLNNATNASGTETRVDVDISSFAVGNYTVQFFASLTCDASGFGEGDRVVGSTTVVQPGTNGILLNELVPGGQAITATATDSNGNTSEFSACVLVDVNPTMVNNTNDSGQGSLRSAIINSNSLAGTQTIAFNIPGGGPHTIQPASPLPAISSPAIIDGYTQPGASANTDAVGSNAILKIVLRGAGLGGEGPPTGFTVTGGGTTIRGLAITGFGNQGIFLDGPTGNNVVEGNFIGTDVTGLSAGANGTGIVSQSPGNLIGGPALSARNVVSGNAQVGIRVQSSFGPPPVVSQGSGTTIQNNLVGTTATGMTALSTGQAGIHVSVPNVTIGGTSAALRNVISGNGQSGISTFVGMFGTTVVTIPGNLVVQGNYIGTKADGLTALGNDSGVNILGPNSRIGGDVNTSPGGACTGACNLIAGNTRFGLLVGNQFDFATGTVFSAASGTVVEGNYVGVNVTGSAAIPNLFRGIEVSAPDVIIGGFSAAARNVISGNNDEGLLFFANTYGPGNTAVPGGTGAGGFVRGNFIGLNAAGNGALTNSGVGVWSSVPNVTIGGPQIGAVNVIAAGPSRYGILLGSHVAGATIVSAATGTIIQRNHIGTDLTGTLRLSQGSGVFLTTADNQILGNVIAGNGTTAMPGSGLTIFGSSANNNVVKGNFIGETGADIGDLGNTGVGLNIQDASNNYVGGSLATDRNVIVGSGFSGINITASNGATANGNQVLNNYIGIRRNGLTPQPNSGGIWISGAPGGTVTGNVIGAPGAGNVIGGNANSGVTLDGAATTDTVVAGNFIGVNASNTTALGNTGAGVQINNASGNRIGGSATEGNIIAFNQSGVVVLGEFGKDNQIQSNRIRSNGSLGIDLGWDGVSANDVSDTDNGPNNRQNFPVLTSATNSPGPNTKVTADVSSFFPGSYTLEFFASATCDGSGHGEGERQVGIFTGVPSGGTQVFTLSEAVPAGQFITATATDQDGNTSEFSACTAVGAGTTVTNTNNSGPGSLHDAIVVANTTPGTQTISFDIPGVTAATPAVITPLHVPLPEITEAVIIDGTSQSGYDGLPVIEVRAASTLWTGFSLASSGVTIKGLSVTQFSHGIFAVEGFSGHHIAQNLIGTNRSQASGLGNTTGIEWRASGSTIRDNVVSGNTANGFYLQSGAGGNTILNNYVGVRAAGTAILPNGGTGIVFEYGAHDNTLDGNMVSGNGGWGVDIRHFPGQSQVSNTTFRGNVIGLDASGGDAGNFQGGIRVNLAPGTQIGVVGAAPNVISGNGGNQPQEIGVGIQVIGTAATMPRIRHNYIGLDMSGKFARSNNNKGIVLDGPAFIGGTRADEGNWISGNGDASGGAGIIVGPNAGGSLILGNTIGLNVDNNPVGNGYSGITLTAANPVNIGSPAPDQGNVISGNGVFGISIIRILASDPAPANAFIENNFIGTDASGTLARGNGQAGISVSGSWHHIGGPGGRANVIAHNGAQGISVNGNAGATRVAIAENSIRNNAGLGIDLGADGVTANDNGDADAGVNNTQNFPVIISATNNPAAGPNTVVTVDLSSFAGGSYQLEFFANASCDASGHGEGDSVVGTFGGILAQSSPRDFVLSGAIAAGSFITATATDSNNSTSEFSACVAVSVTTYSVTGIARYSGDSLQGVTIELVQGTPTDPAAYSATTNADGFYDFPQVLPGVYWVKAYGPDPAYVSWTALQITVGTTNVTQDLQLPKNIQLLEPFNTQDEVSERPYFSWVANPQAFRYVIQINHTATWERVDPEATSSTNEYTVQTTLIGGEKYTWQVDAYDEANRPVGSTTQSFTFTVVMP